MAKAKKVKLGRKFETCPSCGYSGAMHVWFVPLRLGALSKSRGLKGTKVRMNLKCPGCRSRFDLGLVVEIGK